NMNFQYWGPTIDDKNLVSWTRVGNAGPFDVILDYFIKPSVGTTVLVNSTPVEGPSLTSLFSPIFNPTFAQTFYRNNMAFYTGIDSSNKYYDLKYKMYSSGVLDPQELVASNHAGDQIQPVAEVDPETKEMRLYYLDLDYEGPLELEATASSSPQQYSIKINKYIPSLKKFNEIGSVYPPIVPGEDLHKIEFYSADRGNVVVNVGISFGRVAISRCINAIPQ
ncbi:MAG: hypothetical protein Q7S13_02225, partial [Candidatus Omnitrophota bacterium]|nr:hypothetical protein [Candidatus Omnitrophota bacterium]